MPNSNNVSTMPQDYDMTVRPQAFPMAVETETLRFMQRVYTWMFSGLLVSGIAAWVTANNPDLIDIFLTRPTIYIILGAELLLVFVLSWAVKSEKLPAVWSIFFFFLYSLLTGLTLSIIFLIYTLSSIGLVFFIAAGMFGAMSIYGYVTKKDLTSWGSLLFMALIGIIIASIANMFFQNQMLSYIVSFIGVIVFTGLTAYDTQKIKASNILGNEGTDADLKESIFGALRLYLDFINLFLELLSLFGKRR
jgi:FtsH-binding integral membrane protein